MTKAAPNGRVEQADRSAELASRRAGLPNGSAAAAILASAVACLAMGAITTLGETVQPIGDLLNLSQPVGSLSGKSVVAIVVWLVAWAVLELRWRNKHVEFPPVFRATMVLIGLGLLGTFPLFWELFKW